MNCKKNRNASLLIRLYIQGYYYFPLGNWDSFICSFCLTWPLRDAKIHFEAEPRVWFLLKSSAQSEIKPFLSSHIVLKKLFLRVVWLSSIFPFFYFFLSFIFILLIFTSSCFSSKQNYSSLLCFCFCFWLLYLKHLLCFVSFCCLDVMIWKPDVILIGILSHTTSSIWVFQCSVTYPVPASLSSGPYLTSLVISAQPINLFPPNIQGIKLICEWTCIMRLRF